MAEALSDLERRVYSRLANYRRAAGQPVDQQDLSALAKLAVDTLTTGSASGRRLRAMDRRETDPGCTPDKIRQLARTIEDTFTTMPNGWVRAVPGKTYD